MLSFTNTRSARGEGGGEGEARVRLRKPGPGVDGKTCWRWRRLLSSGEGGSERARDAVEGRRQRGGDEGGPEPRARGGLAETKTGRMMGKKQQGQGAGVGLCWLRMKARDCLRPEAVWGFREAPGTSSGGEKRARYFFPGPRTNRTGANREIRSSGKPSQAGGRGGQQQHDHQQRGLRGGGAADVRSRRCCVPPAATGEGKDRILRMMHW